MQHEPAPGATLSPGDVVDRYVVEARLGSGGMATVYRVRHSRLGSLHALKLLDLGSRRMRERFLQEGRLQARLRHRHIVAVSDVVEADEHLGLVMELIDGPTLAALLHHGPLPLPAVQAIGAAILKGVAAAHALGFVHRDLKPDNVLLAQEDGEWVPKVADFGIAKLLDDDGGAPGHTRTGAVMGTPAYMSPEQIEDAKHVDHRTDVFSLGAVLYELLTGQRAFTGERMIDVFNAVGSGHYRDPRELRPDAPEPMVAAIRAALAPHRDDRPADVRALLSLWSGASTVDDAPLEVAAVAPAPTLASDPTPTAPPAPRTAGRTLPPNKVVVSRAPPRDAGAGVGWFAAALLTLAAVGLALLAAEGMDSLSTVTLPASADAGP